MITVEIPEKLNGEQLSKELGGAILWINEDGLHIQSDKSATQIKAIVANHKPIDFTAAKEAAKAALLEKLGITEEEAKLLLS